MRITIHVKKESYYDSDSIDVTPEQFEAIRLGNCALVQDAYDELENEDSYYDFSVTDEYGRTVIGWN